MILRLNLIQLVLADISNEIINTKCVTSSGVEMLNFKCKSVVATKSKSTKIRIISNY